MLWKNSAWFGLHIQLCSNAIFVAVRCYAPVVDRIALSVTEKVQVQVPLPLGRTPTRSRPNIVREKSNCSCFPPFGTRAYRQLRTVIAHRLFGYFLPDSLQPGLPFGLPDTLHSNARHPCPESLDKWVHHARNTSADSMTNYRRSSYDISFISPLYIVSSTNFSGCTYLVSLARVHRSKETMTYYRDRFVYAMSYAPCCCENSRDRISGAWLIGPTAFNKIRATTDPEKFRISSTVFHRGASPATVASKGLMRITWHVV